jgi:hypothetical protein
MKIKVNKTGRRCKCGYLYSGKVAVGSRKFASYAVVSDRSYQRFLKAELGALQAANAGVKLRAIARASKLVGSLLECPDCGRFLLAMPGGSSKTFYLIEDAA